MTLPLIARALYETARISVPTVVDARRGRLRAEDASARLLEWSRRLLEQAQVRLAVTGLEHLDAVGPGEEGGSSGGAATSAGGGARVGEVPRSFVVMSNHQSLYDIPVLFRALPLPFRMVAKTELFRIPIWGQAMLAAGFVRIDRSRGAEAYRVMQERGRELRESGLSVWVAPEGTRSPDGRLLPFHGGGFALARCLGMRILPVSIEGTRHVLGKKQWRITKGRAVHVYVHAPVDPESFASDRNGIEALLDHVRRAIAGPLTVDGE